MKKRLVESDDWGTDGDNLYYDYLSDYTYVIDLEDTEVRDMKDSWIKHKPHQIWKLLDKIDAAKAKGGKQVVKFKGCEYEFDFPAVDKVEGKEVTKTPTQAEWQQVTDYDSIRFNNDSLFYIEGDRSTDGFVCSTDRRFASSYATEKQAKQALAWAKITQIHKAMIDGSEGVVKVIDVHGLWVQSIDLYEGRYSFDEHLYENLLSVPICTPSLIEFYSKEQRDHFINHNENLLNQYLGHETNN